MPLNRTWALTTRFKRVLLKQSTKRKHGHLRQWDAWSNRRFIT